MLAIFGMALSGCGNQTGTVVAEPIKIGTILPLTGNNSYLGQYIREGIDLAAAKINFGNGINGRKAEMVYEDSAGDTAKGVSAYQNLAQTQNVKLFFSSLSGVTLAVAPLSEADKNILFNIGSASPKISSAGDYVFRHSVNTDEEADFLAQSIYNLGYKKIAVIVENSEGTQGPIPEFIKKFNSLGGEIVLNETHNYGETDFRTILGKVKQKNPAAIVDSSFAVSEGNLLKQAREMKIFTQWFGFYYSGDPKVLDVAREAMDGIIFSQFFDPSSNSSTTKNYQQDFKRMYNKESEYNSALAYDGLMMLSKAIGKCTDLPNDCIKNELYKIKNYDGATGMISFDSNGDTSKEIFLMTERGNVFSKYNK